MCDPMTMILGAVGMIGGMMSMGQKQPDPPAAETPAIAAPTGRNPGATVRLGNNADDITNNLSPDSTQPSIFQERRTSGNSLGNLGRSALAL